MNFRRFLLAVCFACLLICPSSIAQQSPHGKMLPPRLGPNKGQTKKHVSALPAAAQAQISGVLGRDLFPGVRDLSGSNASKRLDMESRVYSYRFTHR
jgi:hypothetical protein